MHLDRSHTRAPPAYTIYTYIYIYIEKKSIYTHINIYSAWDSSGKKIDYIQIISFYCYCCSYLGYRIHYHHLCVCVRACVCLRVILVAWYFECINLIIPVKGIPASDCEQRVCATIKEVYILCLIILTEEKKTWYTKKNWDTTKNIKCDLFESWLMWDQIRSLNQWYFLETCSEKRN